MTAVGIVPHPQRAGASAERAARFLADAGVEVRVPAPIAEAVGLSHLARDVETFATGLDFVISLGGDGTMLRTVALVAPEGVPVLGVNLGQLGFLTEVEPSQLEDALRRALAGEFQISERMLLSV
ncbi:MAG TPA: NAD(+)/NADH kinase, partial [Acidimicrobiia bacterium]|nr:NAD(+)/NADH kinase [Acidimicrobiia bacterium]